jgi:tRNA pseudouridine38-40 synthase
VSEAKTVRSAFHARHDAVAKTYEYRLLLASDCSPFLARYVYACPWPLDFSALQAAARLFEGEHDFTSFAATDPDLATREAASGEVLIHDANLPATRFPVRTIYSSAWDQRRNPDGDLLVYRVRGNGFLHHMVRNLAGTMIDVGRAQIAVEDIPRILAALSRSAAGPTAPARGLFLHSVEYDEEIR